MAEQMGRTLTDSISVGIVGTGFVGKELGKQLRDNASATVRALTDVNEANLSEAGETLGVSSEFRFLDYEEMLATESLDAVVISTPHSFHYEHAVTALEHDVHVLCEKPLAIDLDEARDLVRQADESQQIVMVGYQRHLGRAYLGARSELRERSLDPKFVTAEITQNWISKFAETWRADPDLSGGGQLYDTGSHLIDAVLWVTDLTPTEVSAEITFHDERERVDTQAMINVRFENGAIANIAVSGDTPCTREHIHIWGDDGGIFISGREWNERELTFVDSKGEEAPIEPEAPSEESKVEAFLRSIRTSEEPPATARDALYVTAVTEAAYESARTGERVSIDL